MATRLHLRGSLEWAGGGSRVYARDAPEKISPGKIKEEAWEIKAKAKAKPRVVVMGGGGTAQSGQNLSQALQGVIGWANDMVQ